MAWTAVSESCYKHTNKPDMYTEPILVVLALMTDEARFCFMWGQGSESPFMCNGNGININLSQRLLK